MPLTSSGYRDLAKNTIRVGACTYTCLGDAELAFHDIEKEINFDLNMYYEYRTFNLAHAKTYIQHLTDMRAILLKIEEHSENPHLYIGRFLQKASEIEQIFTNEFLCPDDRQFAFYHLERLKGSISNTYCYPCCCRRQCP